MADNTTLNTGSGGDTIASDDIGGVKHQRVKIEYGVDGAATDVSDTNPLPIDDAGGSITVDAAELTAIQTAVEIIDNAISGTEMQTDVLSVIPGIGATDLGKAIDSAVGATDTGVALLAKHTDDLVHLTEADGDYVLLSTDSLGSLHTNAEAHHTFDTMDATTGWTVLGNDTLNLATTTKHVLGTAALSFDKVDGVANTVLAGIQKTVSSTDLGDVSLHDIIQTACYTSSVTDVDYIFCRIGTDSTNYNEWRIPGSSLTAGIFETVAFNIGDPDHGGITGNGWDETSITYIAVGAAFNSETDTLASIIFDHISYHTNQHTSASLGSEVTSSVNSANINLQKVGGSTTDKGAGNASAGSQRVVLATDDVNAAAIKTAVEGTLSVDGSAVTQPVSGTVTANLSATDNAVLDVIEVNTSYGDNTGTGTEAGCLRVTLATDSTGLLSIDDNGASLTVDNADITTIAGAVNGSEMQVDVVAPLPAGTNAIGKLSANTGVDIGDVDVLSLPALATGSNAIGKLAANSGVDIGDVDVTSISAGSTLIGDVGISGARTSGGTTFYRNIDADETEDAVKTSAGQIYFIQCTNLDATPIYLQLYNATVASVTVGTTTADLTFCVPSQGDANGAGFVLAIPNGIAFGTAITVAATTTAAGSGGPAANEVILNIGYA